MMFGGNRHIVYFNTTAYEAKFNKYGGTEAPLPNSDYQGGSTWHSVTTEWSDGEWWEFIIYEERLSSTVYRKRIWMRELTSNDVIIGPPSSASWLRTFGMVSSGSVVPTGEQGRIQLGINRNKPMFAGQLQHFFWGPWEVIDGSMLPDPYGIENQIRENPVTSGGRMTNANSRRPAPGAAGRAEVTAAGAPRPGEFVRWRGWGALQRGVPARL